MHGQLRAPLIATGKLRTGRIWQVIFNSGLIKKVLIFIWQFLWWKSSSLVYNWQEFYSFWEVTAAGGLQFAIYTDISVNLAEPENSASAFCYQSCQFLDRWLLPQSLRAFFLKFKWFISLIQGQCQRLEYYCLLTCVTSGKMIFFAVMWNWLFIFGDQPLQLTFPGLEGHRSIEGIYVSFENQIVCL